MIRGNMVYQDPVGVPEYLVPHLQLDLHEFFFGKVGVDGYRAGGEGLTGIHEEGIYNLRKDLHTDGRVVEGCHNIGIMGGQKVKIGGQKPRICQLRRHAPYCGGDRICGLEGHHGP